MIFNVLVSIFIINSLIITNGDTHHGIMNSKRKVLNRSDSRNFFFVRASIFNERPCICMTEVSCSCCETAFMLYHLINRKICANFMYQRNGLNVDLTVDGNVLNSMTVTNYMAFKLCTSIPGSLSSKVCLNILELNIFPRSITACPRLDFMSKSQRWILTYTCISISTLLPDGNMTTPMTAAMIVQSTTNRPPSSMRPSASQLMQTPRPANQMRSSLIVNSPVPMSSIPQSTAKLSESTSAATTPANSSILTTIMTEPMPSTTTSATSPMNTTNPPGSSSSQGTSASPSK